MSLKQDVIMVFYPLKGISDILKKSLPDADVFDVVEDETADVKMKSRLRHKVTPSEIAQMQKADILITAGRFLIQVLYDLPDVKWVQLVDTGTDSLMSHIQKQKKLPNFIFTRNNSESIGLVMAEYVLGQIICHERSWHLTRQNQLQKVYADGNEFALFRSLQMLTVGVMGLGRLGLEVARSLKHFGSRVIGYSRTPKPEDQRSPYVDEYWHTGQLSSFLSECDYVIGVLPSTSQTRGLLGGGVLKYAKKSPVLVNVGRGDLISEEDVLKALDAGWISKAILDVVEKEPLPQESYLWMHPKVIITPHVSAIGNEESRCHPFAEFFIQNYQRYRKGDNLHGLADWNQGY